MKINSYDELIKYLEENLNTKIILLDKERIDDKEIGYVLEKDEFNDLYVDKEFFFQYENELKEFFLKIVKKNQSAYRIPNMLITEELVDYIVQSEELNDTGIILYNVCEENLDNKLREKLVQSNKYIILNKELISTFEGSQYKRLFEMDYVIRDVFKLTEDDIDLFCLHGNHTKIWLVANFELNTRLGRNNFLNNESLSMFKYDEKEYLKKVLEILKKLKNDERKYDIVIYVNNRELLKQSGILEMEGFNFFLADNTVEYTKEEYEREEEVLNELVKPVMKYNLSPFERYLAVYNIVKRFKKYKENYENKDESRELKYTLYNEYMTCLGFSKLLKVLLEKVGISSFIISTNIDHSYDSGFTLEDKPTDFQRNHHARNIVKIDDDNYGIHGIYLADSTWDNNFEFDLYSNAVLTFDEKKEALALEELKVIDLLMDFHNKDEFMEKFNYLVKMMEKPYDNGESFKKEVIYNLIYLKICEIVRSLDYEKYEHFFKKYEDRLGILDNLINDFDSQLFNDFLNEYMEYMLPLVNKPIDSKKIMLAGMLVKKYVNDYDDKMLKKWLINTSRVYKLLNEEEFPYKYDPNEWRSNYLEIKENQGKKR